MTDFRHASARAAIVNVSNPAIRVVIPAICKRESRCIDSPIKSGNDGFIWFC